jgi:hypothetical protein
VPSVAPDLERHLRPASQASGRRAELKARLDALAAARPADGPVTLRAIGYTRAMDEYMAAADLLVGKPGGLTTAEALARRLPMVLVHPIPGQEERNADHLLEAGAARGLDRCTGRATGNVTWLADFGRERGPTGDRGKGAGRRRGDGASSIRRPTEVGAEAVDGRVSATA